MTRNDPPADDATGRPPAPAPGAGGQKLSEALGFGAVPASVSPVSMPTVPPREVKRAFSAALPREDDATPAGAPTAPVASPADLSAFGVPTPPPDAMVKVAGGRFLMGETKQPADVPAFEIDRDPVTHGDYERFVVATGHRPPLYWRTGRCPDDLRDHPVVGVDYFDAMAYARWVGKDLPYEDEWERAARSTDGRAYPWGDEPDLAANTARTGLKMTLPVGFYGKNVSPDGCRDMVGNAWELTHTPAPGAGVVVRGGSWFDLALYARTWFRSSARTDARNGTIGFRCVRRAGARTGVERAVTDGEVEAAVAARKHRGELPDPTAWNVSRRDLVPDVRRLRAVVASRDEEAGVEPRPAGASGAGAARPTVRKAFTAPPPPPPAPTAPVVVVPKPAAPTPSVAPAAVVRPTPTPTPAPAPAPAAASAATPAVVPAPVVPPSVVKPPAPAPVVVPAPAAKPAVPPTPAPAPTPAPTAPRAPLPVAPLNPLAPAASAAPAAPASAPPGAKPPAPAVTPVPVPTPPAAKPPAPAAPPPVVVPPAPAAPPVKVVPAAAAAVVVPAPTAAPKPPVAPAAPVPPPSVAKPPAPPAAPAAAPTAAPTKPTAPAPAPVGVAPSAPVGAPAPKPAPAVAATAAISKAADAAARAVDAPRPAPEPAVATSSPARFAFLVMGFLAATVVAVALVLRAGRGAGADAVEDDPETLERQGLPAVTASAADDLSPVVLSAGDLAPDLTVLEHGGVLLVFSDSAGEPGARTTALAVEMHRRLRPFEVRTVLVLPREVVTSDRVTDEAAIKERLRALGVTGDLAVLLDPPDERGSGRLRRGRWLVPDPTGAVLVRGGVEVARVTPPAHAPGLLRAHLAPLARLAGAMFGLKPSEEPADDEGDDGR
ncbi:MAG: SUMF1/EgtB/PvdO family nonheme iron enzyme [Planctomycetes bacterium]|nr:SUMF1/EgtB/PvdO family nonheme iron enzyme [Planctomycetota bacterium]